MPHISQFLSFRECSKLCRYSTPSLFCKIPVEKMAEFKWDNLISELHHCCLRFCTAWKQVQDGSCSLSWHLHSSSSAPQRVGPQLSRARSQLQQVGSQLGRSMYHSQEAVVTFSVSASPLPKMPDWTWTLVKLGPAYLERPQLCLKLRSHLLVQHLHLPRYWLDQPLKY